MKSREHKRAFLYTMGFAGLENGRHPTTLWKDPRKPKGLLNTDEAYRIAQARLREREAYALRKAGAKFDHAIQRWKIPGLYNRCTRASALEYYGLEVK